MVAHLLILHQLLSRRGKPQFSPQGTYSALEVKKAVLLLVKQGMNADLQNYADIISRSIEINGKINAKKSL